MQNNTCDLILLDINMPEMDGFEVMTKILENPGLADIPIIFLTADNDPEIESRCLKEGAMDFITKPFVQNVMLSRISHALELESLRQDLEGQLAARTIHIKYIREMMVIGMATMVESRDLSTGGHIKRTSMVVRIFAESLAKEQDSLSKSFLDMVIRAAPMHDLGKIAVDDRVLRKQERFTTEKYAEMKKHSAEGSRIVKQILEGVEEADFVEIAANVAHYHHEKWDGSGYPDGLTGENTPVEARIMAIADRAAQFSPFAALTGYDDAVSETARLTDSRLELDEDRLSELNTNLNILRDNLSERPEVTVEYFVPDEKKSGGAYITFSGRIRLIDEYEKKIIFTDGTEIELECVCRIEIL